MSERPSWTQRYLAAIFSIAVAGELTPLCVTTTGYVPPGMSAGTVSWIR